MAEEAFDIRLDAYTGNEQFHEYTLDPGIIYLPVASSESVAPVRVRIHGGLGYRKVKWSSTRAGSPPHMPKWVLDDDNATDDERPVDRIVNASTTVMLPRPAGDSRSFNFHASGVITYCQVIGTGPRICGTDPLPTGRWPGPISGVDDYCNQFYSSLSLASVNLEQPLPGDEEIKRPSQVIDEHLTTNFPRLLNRRDAWPATVYSPYFTSDTLFQA